MPAMETVTATELKQRLGELLDKASMRKVAIERHGRVVAYLVPVPGPKPARARRGAATTPSLTRRAEERLLDLFTSGDFRPSRWRRAGNPEALAGFAALLASADAGERGRPFALARSGHPGIGDTE